MTFDGHAVDDDGGIVANLNVALPLLLSVCHTNKNVNAWPCRRILTLKGVVSTLTDCLTGTGTSNQRSFRFILLCRFPPLLSPGIPNERVTQPPQPRRTSLNDDGRDEGYVV